jgi:diadenosine tetraphosphate (Ap4A) HIT family hydrolase
MVDGCIFCELYSKKSNILYETERVFVLADVRPLSRGHLLVIPKAHAPFLQELEDEVLKEILVLIKRIVNTLKIKRYNILQNNGHIQSVHHVHFHIIPCTSDTDSLKVKWEVVSVEKDYFEVYISNIKKMLMEMK